MDFAQWKPNVQFPQSNIGNLSIGPFLRKMLDAYWGSIKEQEETLGFDNWTAMLENTQRTYTSAGDLETLDFNAESEYRMFPRNEITIAKGYSTIVESLASVLSRDTTVTEYEEVKFKNLSQREETHTSLIEYEHVKVEFISEKGKKHIPQI
ncbi:hypothetical protein KY284_024812 [Solanum tuberosum]|nr:hypothetical protein KY284_024812 [Solanum tuberosum]